MLPGKKIVVYFNTNPSAMINGHTPGDLLQKVWEGTSFSQAGYNAIAEQVFGYLNNEGPWKDHSPSVPRSMSVGDVIEIGEECYHVGFNGFRPMYMLYIPQLNHFSDEQQDRIKDYFRPEPKDSALFGTRGMINAIKYVRQVGHDKGFKYGLKDSQSFIEKFLALHPGLKA
jgi:hypothetical protein